MYMIWHNNIFINFNTRISCFQFKKLFFSYSADSSERYFGFGGSKPPPYLGKNIVVLIGVDCDKIISVAAVIIIF